MEAQQRASEKLASFLSQVRVKKGEPFTHTTKSPSGSYYIAEEQYDTFMTLYCNAIVKGAKFTLTERPGAYGPLRVDFDMRASLDRGLKRQYTNKTLADIVKFYQNEIRDSVDTENFEDKMLWCIVLEKKAPRSEEGKVKDGFHLHFPNFSCEGWFQDEYLRSRVIEKMLENKTWEGTHYTEPVEKMIDVGMAKKVWLMYGSAKMEKAEPFLCTKAFDENGEQMPLEKVFEDEMAERKLGLRYYLPRFMSIRGYNERVTLKPEIDARRESYVGFGKRKARKIIYKKRSMHEVLEDIKVIRDGEIMEMLSDERADDYDTWIDVGWTLFNIGQGCDEALQLWIDFSKRSSKYEEGCCDDLWGKMEMRDKTIASLLAMAKSDNPDAYKAWKDANVKTVLYKSLFERKPNEWDIASVLHKLYKDRFICADSSKNSWWEFTDHRWRYMDDGITLKKILATEIVDIYYNLKSEISQQGNGLKSENSESDAIRAKIERQEKKCLEIVTALKTCIFQSNVIKMAKVQFYDPNFLKKIDENKLLWGCENGVLDLEFGIFRDGRPDDYITFSCGLEYRQYAKGDDENTELKKFFRHVFPNPNLRRYFKDSVCAAMEGGNKNKTFIVSTGGGDNGKSVTYALLELVFGEYAIKFPREMLLAGQKNSSASARPELARVRGKRLAVLQEVAKTETLNIGVLKELTGNDSFFARSLFEKGTEIKPMFSLHMQCLTGDAKVNLSSGISLDIESMKQNNKVSSWNNSDGLIVAEQKRFLDQGVKNCVKLTLLDGTEITCTPDHRFLTKDGKWIQAKDIDVGKTSLMTGPQYPARNLSEKCSYDFFEYDLNTASGKLEAMALSRVLGYSLADGSNNRILYLGHRIDTEQVLDDIQLLSGKRPAIVTNNHCFQIAIPLSLAKILDSISSPQGKRLHSEMTYPDFIFDSNCPAFIIAEFLAGLFGGDGIIPCVTKRNGTYRNSLSPLQLIASKVSEHLPSLVEKFEKLSQMLKDRFGINSTVNSPLEYEDGKYKVLLSIRDVDVFTEKIGIRYCCHKLYRLTAVAHYLKYKKSITRQNDRIQERALKIFETNSLKDSLEKAISEEDMIFDQEKLINYQQLRNRKMKNVSTSNVFPDIQSFMERTGLDAYINNSSQVNYSVDADRMSLPTFYMPVICRQDAGMHQVYDLTIEKPYSNFVANGIISHNCNEPPKIPGHDDATWNRVRRLDFESRFVLPKDIKKYPVPKTEKEQMEMKRFHGDKDFTGKLPELAPALLSNLFERYKKYKTRGLREPNEVKMATGMYRAMNDVYLQFIQDKVEKIEYPEDTEKKDMVFVSIPEIYAEFNSWYKETHSSYSRERFDRHVVVHEFSKRFSQPELNGRKKGWYGYKIIEEDEIDPKDQKLHQILSKQIEPKIKKIDAKELDKKMTKEEVSKAIEKIMTDDEGESEGSDKGVKKTATKKMTKETVAKAVKNVTASSKKTVAKNPSKAVVPKKKTIKV